MDGKKPEKTKCVRITVDTHQKAKEFVGAKIKIGAFVDEATLEKIKKEKSKK